MVSWMDAYASLRYFLVILNLQKLAVCKERNQLRIGQIEHVVRHLLELPDFVVTNIPQVTFLEAKHENATITFAKKNNAAKSFGFTLAGTSNTLFDNAPAKISINLPFVCTLRSVYQRRV